MRHFMVHISAMICKHRGGSAKRLIAINICIYVDHICKFAHAILYDPRGERISGKSIGLTAVFFQLSPPLKLECVGR